MPALSHWHAANMDELVRETRIKKNFEDYYWGALLLTESYLAWGGANPNAYLMLGLDLRWIDMIGLDWRRQAVPVRNPPPGDYLQLVVVASKRSSPNSIVGFPGAQTPDNSRPVTTGNSVIWGFAVPPSPAEQMMVQLNRQMTSGKLASGCMRLTRRRRCSCEPKLCKRRRSRNRLRVSASVWKGTTMCRCRMKVACSAGSAV